jgi:hypothetical protein
VEAGIVFDDPGLIVAGIDPGLHGAIAVLNEAGDCDTIHMPVMGDKLVIDGGAVARWLGERSPNLVVIERAQAMPEHLQKRKQGAASTFRFGQTYGQLLGVLQASAFPYRIVGAADWKRALHLSRDKELSRRRAIELLPLAGEQFQLKKDEARAEAALIAWWYLHGRTPFRAKIEREGSEKNRRPVS